MQSLYKLLCYFSLVFTIQSYTMDITTTKPEDRSCDACFDHMDSCIAYSVQSSARYLVSCLPDAQMTWKNMQLLYKAIHAQELKLKQD